MQSIRSASIHWATLAIVAVRILFPSPTLAGNTWDGGGGANTDWTYGVNWNPAIGMFQFPPANNGTADIVMPAVGGLVQTPLVDVPYSINSLTFTSGNGRFVILAAEELTIGAGGITNNDADIQSVIGPVKLSANQTWTAAVGRLQMDAVNLNGSSLYLAGAYQIDLISVIAGSGVVDLLNMSTATMSGGISNTFTNFTQVRLGAMLTLQKTGGATAVPGDINISGGGVLLAGNEQISHASGNEVFVNGGGRLNLNGYTETLADVRVWAGDIVTGVGMLKINQSLDVFDGTITGNLSLGDVAAHVRSNGQVTTGSSLLIGDMANGTLNIDTGGDVTDATAYIGDDAGSMGEATVDGMGSTWTNSGSLFVGNYGNGTLNITDKGQVSNEYAVIANYSSSTSGVTVDGADSYWQVNNTLTVGFGGDANLEIANGGSVNSKDTFIADDPQSISSVIVDGTGSTWTNSSNLFVGSSGEGRLDIYGGGDVINAVGCIGDNASSAGEVSVDGTGSTWTNSGDLYVGNTGKGTLNITTGGNVSNATAYVGDDNGSIGAVKVDGIGSTWTNSGDLHVGYNGNGTLEITNGGGVINVIGIIGRFSGSTSSVTVDGAGSTWTNNGGAAVVGYAGAGTLDVTNGGKVTSRYYGFIGDPTGSSRVTVDGTGSTWSISDLGQLDVGANNGFGTLAISAGGHVANVVGSVGKYVGGGAATVDGAGSLWTNSSYLSVGESGDGMLNITAGGQVTNTDAYIGWMSDNTGAVTIDGSGSTWTSTGYVSIGRGVAHGRLAISGGGQVTSDSADIGYGSGSTGEVTVDGISSMWAITNDLNVSLDSDGGDATLTVTNGGTVSAVNVYVNEFGRIHGDGIIVGFVQNGGLVSPGTSPGVLTIDGDYTQTAPGELLIELASAASYDQLQVTDNATLGGTLTVDFIDDFIPLIGQMFTILTADDVDDSFAMGVFPSVPNLEFDLIYNAQSVVLIVVPSLPGDYNGDGTVDAADYVVWRKNDSTQEGYDDWRSHFGQTGGGSFSNTTVPEPTTLALLIVTVAGWCLRRGRAVNKVPATHING